MVLVHKVEGVRVQILIPFILEKPMRYDTPEKKAAHAAEERARRRKNPEEYRKYERARRERRQFDRAAYNKAYNARPDQKAKRTARDKAKRDGMTPGELAAYQMEQREYYRNYRIKKAEELREKRVKKKYGISFTETFAAQGFKCAVEHPDNHLPQHKKGWQVDHCHRKGHTRAILCGRCNAALGSVNDNSAWLRALADYVEKYGKE
jgi:hypothetical protein